MLAAAGDPLARLREAAGLPQSADVDTLASALSFTLRKAPGYWRVVAEMIGADPNGTRDELEAALGEFLQRAESRSTAARACSSHSDCGDDLAAWQALSQSEREGWGSLGTFVEQRRGAGQRPRVAATATVSTAPVGAAVNLTALKRAWYLNRPNERGVPLQDEFGQDYEAYPQLLQT
ncbi:MAG: hypothetical protein AB1716_24375 [Planctomycetota bacterium]